jgi:hypothetical protein
MARNYPRAAPPETILCRVITTWHLVVAARSGVGLRIGRGDDRKTQQPLRSLCGVCIRHFGISLWFNHLQITFSPHKARFGC